MLKKELQDFEYAKFKEFVYEIYLRDLDEPDKNIIDVQRAIVHNRFKSEQLDKIYKNTIAFPYDIELFNYLIGKRLSPETMRITIEKFDIPMDLLIAKIEEYTMYPIDKINGLELIDKELTLKLSKCYAKQKDEKNYKSVDF